ncbi:MAG: pyridoxamine 5'-phosphate oxidase family protein [Gillisia sp.]
MINDLFKEAITELKSAVKQNDHPFRYCSVASCDSAENLRQRTMILRDITDNEHLLFYTDSRSIKIKHFKVNTHVSVLFYDPKNNLQLVIKGKMKVYKNNEDYHYHKSNIEGKAVNNYNTRLAPGKKLNNPFNISRTTELHFALLELETQSIEFLKIRKDPNHLRALFTRKEKDWEKTFLVP